MQMITPFLWFDTQAEEAANYYVSVFKNAPTCAEGRSKIISITRYDEEGAKASGMVVGTVMTVEFQLDGQRFVALNGGSYFKFSGAVSFVVNCETQEEVDWFWERLSAEGGEKGVCGWINHDKFGVTWQVVPTILPEMLQGKDPEKTKRVMAAMLKMSKIDIEGLRNAYERQ
jgi:predicted 3-demethylubiquinone-9 3-methyltransferase (glyoxalase superfamily)